MSQIEKKSGKTPPKGKSKLKIVLMFLCLALLNVGVIAYIAVN